MFYLPWKTDSKHYDGSGYFIHYYIPSNKHSARLGEQMKDLSFFFSQRIMFYKW